MDTHIQTIIFGGNDNKFHYCIWTNLKVISLKLNSGESKTKHQQVKDFIYILNDIIFKLKEWRNEVYRSGRTWKPGPVGSPVRDVRPEIGSAANLPFLKKQSYFEKFSH